MLNPLLFRDHSCINAGMGNISSAFQDALAAQAKAALVDVVATNPRISVKDLAELVASNPQLGSLTLDELLGESEEAGKPGRGRGGRRKAVAAPAGQAGGAPGAAQRKVARKGGAHKRNVRTETGREAFDTEVLDGLKELGGENVNATSLRNALDADPTQLRTALNRLIERGIVTFTGKARGTRYSLAE
jgi:hypothetical protein